MSSPLEHPQIVGAPEKERVRSSSVGGVQLPPIPPLDLGTWGWSCQSSPPAHEPDQSDIPASYISLFSSSPSAFSPISSEKVQKQATAPEAFSLKLPSLNPRGRVVAQGIVDFCFDF